MILECRLPRAIGRVSWGPSLRDTEQLHLGNHENGDNHKCPLISEGFCKIQPKGIR